MEREEVLDEATTPPRRRSPITPFFLVGCIALAVCANAPFLPLESREVMLGVLFPSVVVFALLQSTIRTRGPSKGHWALAVFPWFVASLLLVNGFFDRSPALTHSTVVEKTAYAYGVGFRHGIVVRSWRPGRTTESIPVPLFQGFYYPGERVTITVREGALGLPWITAVSRDR